MNKKILLLIIGISLIGIVSASYCCEKTVSGAWCQNVNYKDECAISNDLSAPAPTSCDATSFCQMGTCIDKDGVCKRNTAKKTCSAGGGYWVIGNPEALSQCQKGCCIVGELADFVEQAKCKSYASLYGAEVDFRKNIKSEIECSISVTSDVKGACVFEKENVRDCKFLTQKECLNSKGEFHQNYLCSANWLNTTCSPSDKTICSNEKVYFVDTCGNIANVYDSDLRGDPLYWTNVIEPQISCGYGNSNANSATCGNCDYYLGSTCVAYKRGQDLSPKLGNNICRDLSCKYEGKTYQNGETWCAKDSTNNDLPGSQHYVLKCYNNEVTVESCDVRRATICVQDDVNGFKSAACRANLWQDCISQDNERDCSNSEQRDCKWIEKFDFGTYNSNGEGVCVPAYAPGFDFWSAEGQAKEICSTGTVTCIVTYKKRLLSGGWSASDCTENCECLPEDKNHNNWLNKVNGVCTSLGDCGSSVNFKEQKGYNILNATRV